MLAIFLDKLTLILAVKCDLGGRWLLKGLLPVHVPSKFYPASPMVILILYKLWVSNGGKPRTDHMNPPRGFM